jgi:hypothetical protein
VILARENDTKELWIQAHEIFHTTGGGGRAVALVVDKLNFKLCSQIVFFTSETRRIDVIKQNSMYFRSVNIFHQT